MSGMQPSSSKLQYNLRVGIIGAIYLVGMSVYTLGSVVTGLLTDKLVSIKPSLFLVGIVPIHYLDSAL